MDLQHKPPCSCMSVKIVQTGHASCSPLNPEYYLDNVLLRGLDYI